MHSHVQLEELDRVNTHVCSGAGGSCEHPGSPVCPFQARPHACLPAVRLAGFGHRLSGLLQNVLEGLAVFTQRHFCEVHLCCMWY